MYRDPQTDMLSNFYADLSHIENISNENYRRNFITAMKGYFGDDVNNRQILISKLMYGSDWSMLAKELIYKNYFTCISDMFESIESKVARDQFIGDNAKQFFGLDDITRGSGKRFIEDGRFKAKWMNKL